MGEVVWKKINVLGPWAVNGLDVVGYGLSGPEKSWTVPSLPQTTRSVSLEKTQTPMMSSEQRKTDQNFGTFRNHRQEIFHVISHLQVSQISKITSKM